MTVKTSISHGSSGSQSGSELKGVTTARGVSHGSSGPEPIKCRNQVGRPMFSVAEQAELFRKSLAGLLVGTTYERIADGNF